MFKHFRVVLRIILLDIRSFFKSIGMNKARLKRILAFFVSGIIIFGSFCYKVYATGVIQEYKPTFANPPATIPGDLSFSQAQKLVDAGISAVLELHGLSEGSVELSFYEMMYEKLITDDCHLSYSKDGSGPHKFDGDDGYTGMYYMFSSPGVWNEDYLTYFIANLTSAFIYYDANTFWDYAVARLAAENSKTPFVPDPYVQKSPISVKSDTFKDHIKTANKMYFPKNASGKISYRTDERFSNYIKGSSSFYRDCELYVGQNFGFSAVGGGNEMYIVVFENLGADTYYSTYQYHFTVSTEDVYYEDRDEVEYTGYTLNLEYWDMVDGSQEHSTNIVLFSKSRNSYFSLRFYLASRFVVDSFSSYNNFLNYLSNSNEQVITNHYMGNFLKSDMSSTISLKYDHFNYSPSLHDEKSKCVYNGNCDIGYVASTTPLDTIYTIDTSQIPNNYYITVSGDTIYDYSITNPETGQKDTIQNFITNNYTFTTNNNGDTNIDNGDHNTSIGGSGNVGNGDVNVNVTVNNNIGGGGGGSYDMPDTSFFDDYLDDALKESSGIRKFIADFFDSMPGQITKLICIGLVLAILCRLIGR